MSPGARRSYRAPRGTRDLLPAELVAWRRLEELARDLARRYGYPPMETPLFEEREVFERGIGAVTDVVEKELFRVQSGSEGDRWALRPEATAGIVRAYLQHGMHTLPQPVRLSLWGPMFRYDRPQAGRYRQFWQWDVEAIGDAGPAIDAEIVELGHRFYGEAGLTGVKAQLNSIGDVACRPAYIAELVSYFADHAGALPELERRRLDQNPLRLLDSKDPRMAPLIAGAPRMVDRLCDDCRRHFDAVLDHLAKVDVPVALDPTLVRGLDYYTRTAFEYRVPGADGSQQALGGGGRYDGLVELLGGRPTPGIGFALGIDRVLLLLEEQAVAAPALPRPVAVVVGSDTGGTAARLRIATDLRAAGMFVRADLAERKLGRQLESAAREGAHFAIILPDDAEVTQVQLKDLQAGTQRAVNVADLARELQRAEASHHHGPPKD
jgi:histidyl-tRNA synthetase